jgi:hypothetical protein
MADVEATPDTDIITCSVHPGVETTLRCNKCGRPMCTKCAVLTPVGYRCRECVRGQQAVFYNANRLDPLIQFVVSFPLSAVAAGIIGAIGGALGFFFVWLVTIPAASFAGALIADLAHRAVGKRRSKYGWLAVACGVVLGAVLVGLIPVVLYGVMLMGAWQGIAAGADAYPPLLYGFSGFASVGWWIYVVAATVAAIGRLRFGGRVRF